MRRDLLILFAAVLLIRLPFIGEAVQGDDVYYLLFAQNAQVDPLHPMQMGFRFQGETVWAAGHTRPPLNAYILGGLIAALGEIRELEFHLAYLLFTLVAVFSAYFLARRFCDRPLVASFLFLAVPALLVNGNKLEADLPLLAFWTAGFAFFFYDRFALSAAAMSLAGMCAYQSVFAVPILAHWAWYQRRRSAGAWIASLAAPATIVAWQIFERATSGVAPAAVLAGYFDSYGLLAAERKLKSAASLLAHLGFLVSPLLTVLALRGRILLFAAVPALAGVVFLQGYGWSEKAVLALCFACGIAVLIASVRILLVDRAGDEGLLAAWVFVFFAASLAVFYAGSARYLLPAALPVILLVVRRVRSTAWLLGATVAHLALGLALAWADYDYANQYRAFARKLQPLTGGARIWTNAEWGLRHYLGVIGGEALLLNQDIPEGAIVVESSLAAIIPYRFEGAKSELLRAEIASGPVPTRMIGHASNSGYSSSEFGLLPFGLGGGVIDTVVAYSIGRPEPTLSYLRMDSADAEAHLLAGFYPSDGAEWRWAAPRGAAVLQTPENVESFEIVFHIPDGAPARHLRVTANGETIADESYQTAGNHTLRVPYSGDAGETVRIEIEATPGYSPEGDDRELAIITMALGFNQKEGTESR